MARFLFQQHEFLSQTYPPTIIANSITKLLLVNLGFEYGFLLVDVYVSVFLQTTTNPLHVRAHLSPKAFFHNVSDHYRISEFHGTFELACFQNKIGRAYNFGFPTRCWENMWE